MKNLIITLCVLSLFSCKTEKAPRLSKVSREVLIEMHENNKFDLSKAVFLTQNRKKISSDATEKIREGVYSCDYYMDENNIIREAIVRPATYHDRITSILMKYVDYDPGDGVPELKINCDSIKSLMPYLHQVTAEEWPDLPTDTLDHFQFQTAKLAAITHQCGMPTKELLGTHGLNLFWLMAQHSPPEVIAYYYLHFEKIADESASAQEKIALATDRLLTRHNYPQVFGSQFVNGRLHPIENRDSVDIRRAAIGLGPLSEYFEVVNYEEL